MDEEIIEECTEKFFEMQKIGNSIAELLSKSKVSSRVAIIALLKLLAFAVTEEGSETADVVILDILRDSMKDRREYQKKGKKDD